MRKQMSFSDIPASWFGVTDFPEDFLEPPASSKPSSSTEEMEEVSLKLLKSLSAPSTSTIFSPNWKYFTQDEKKDNKKKEVQIECLKKNEEWKEDCRKKEEKMEHRKKKEERREKEDRKRREERKKKNSKKLDSQDGKRKSNMEKQAKKKKEETKNKKLDEDTDFEDYDDEEIEYELNRLRWHLDRDKMLQEQADRKREEENKQK